MLPNVWSVAEFKKQSQKIFSSRSSQLQAIDRALAVAHSSGTDTDAGAKAINDLLNEISNWRKFKAAQGTRSGRARAVDALEAQLAAAAEQIFKRKIGAPSVQPAFGKPLPPIPGNVAQPIPPKPLPPIPGKIAPPFPPKPLPPIPGKVAPPFPPKPLPPIPGKVAAPLSPKPLPPIPPTPLVPPPPGTKERLFDYLAQAMIDRRQKVMAYDDEDLFDDLEAMQKGRLAARWMLAVPAQVTDVDAARGEALRVLGAMLGNDVGTIKRLLESNLEVVVIPRDQGMTVLDQFKSIRGQQTFDGRSWDSVRGVGNVKDFSLTGMLLEHQQLRAVRDSRKGPGAVIAIDPAKGKIYTAITEENLLGGLTTAPGGGCYATGYSTTTHEFAHSIHQYGLSAADRATIDRVYKIRLAQAPTEEWVDGPRQVGGQSCYASMTVMEYFAQLSNAWLGTNTGNDPYTDRPRNNGKAWVLAHEPKLITDVLERVYGKTALDHLNPAAIIKS